MYAELSLNHKLLKNVIEKAVSPAVRREVVEHLMQVHGVKVVRRWGHGRNHTRVLRS
jgi:hypothetical protein